MTLKVCVDKKDREVIRDVLRARYLHLYDVAERAFKDPGLQKVLEDDRDDVFRVLDFIEKLPVC